MSSSMRDLINIMDDVPQNTELYEGIFDNILSAATAIVSPVARARNQGIKEIKDVTKRAMQKFALYMGHNKMDWNTVTWNILNKYLTLSDQLGLSVMEVRKLVSDPTIKQNILTKVKSNVPAGTWFNGSKPISGDASADNAGKIAQVIVATIMELAVIKYFEKKADQAGGKEVGWEVEAGGPPPPKPDPSADVKEKLKYQIQLKMWQLENPLGESE